MIDELHSRAYTKNTMIKEPTNLEILQAINEFATNTEQRLSSLEIDTREMKADVRELKSDMRGVKSSMVTKAYLDEKLADLRGDLVALTRKEDAKVVALVKTLGKRKALTKADQENILDMEPFARNS